MGQILGQFVDYRLYVVTEHWIPLSTGAAGPKQPASIPEIGSTSHDRKRKRFAMEGDEEGSTLENQLIDVVERNGKMLADYLHAQNSHSQLDREQRKEHSDNLVAVLNKLADAFMRIAEKL